jgi:hypothetical protein
MAYLSLGGLSAVLDLGVQLWLTQMPLRDPLGVGGGNADEWNRRLNDLTINALPIAHSKN